jgi:hypothetical protein
MTAINHKERFQFLKFFLKEKIPSLAGGDRTPRSPFSFGGIRPSLSPFPFGPQTTPSKRKVERFHQAILPNEIFSM